MLGLGGFISLWVFFFFFNPKGVIVIQKPVHI